MQLYHPFLEACVILQTIYIYKFYVELWLRRYAIAIVVTLNVLLLHGDMAENVPLSLLT